MNDLPEKPPIQNPSRRSGSRGWFGLLLVAGLIGGGIYAWLAIPKSPQATIDRAIETSLMPVDRRYNVALESQGPIGLRKDAELWLRGSDRMSLSIAIPIVGAFRMGRDGKEYWVLPPVGPLVDTTADGPLIQQFGVDAKNMPYLEVATMLKKIKEHYQLQRAESERITEQGPRLDHLIATRAPGEREGQPPFERIDLWCDPWTGVVHQIAFSKSSQAKVVDKWFAKITLIEEKQQPADFYSGEYHIKLRGG